MTEVDTVEELFLVLKRTPYDQVLQQAELAGYVKSIHDVRNEKFNNILTSNGWNMDDFIDEYNASVSPHERYIIRNIEPDMCITRAHG